MITLYRQTFQQWKVAKIKIDQRVYSSVFSNLLNRNKISGVKPNPPVETNEKATSPPPPPPSKNPNAAQSPGKTPLSDLIRNSFQKGMADQQRVSSYPATRSFDQKQQGNQDRGPRAPPSRDQPPSRGRSNPTQARRPGFGQDVSGAPMDSHRFDQKGPQSMNFGGRNPNQPFGARFDQKGPQSSPGVKQNDPKVSSKNASRTKQSRPLIHGIPVENFTEDELIDELDDDGPEFLSPLTENEAIMLQKSVHLEKKRSEVGQCHFALFLTSLSSPLPPLTLSLLPVLLPHVYT